MLQRSGLRSAHYKTAPDAPPIGAVFLANQTAGRPLLTGIEGFDVYADLGLNAGQVVFEGAHLFRQLHAEHPDAYFLLNTRPVDDWVASRMRFREGALATHCARILGCGTDALPDLWREMFGRHHADVREHFSCDSGKLLEFDITSDSPDAIKDFLSPIYQIDTAHWKLINASAPSTPPPEQRNMAARASGGLWNRLARRRNHG